jgi:predicted component of type VI protein secretion system
MTTLSVGRHPDCDIVISDPTVSRHHAELSQIGTDLYMFTDQGSTSGSFRFEDGGWKRITSARLRSSERVRLGAFESTVGDLLRQSRSAKPTTGATTIERDPVTGQIVVRPR